MNENFENLEKQLEQALKQAMARRDPPSGFSAKVMAKVEAKRDHWWQIFFLPLYRTALAGGLACVILVGGGLAYHQHQMQERKRAEAARDQLLLALRITGKQLNRVGRVISTAGLERR